MKGQFFKSYFIVGELGEGGMSKVFLAFDLKGMRFVAVKFLHQNIQQSRMFLSRLRREVNIYRDLDHKNVINLVEDGLSETPPYVVLEYLRGTPLDKLVRAKGALPPGQCFEILSDITEALHSMHRGGIIHRDLQPGNVILTYMGWAKVFDFGIAKRADGLVETEPGTVMGTVIYCAPEQNMGMPVDARADMYSLGLILFELLTGQRALQGSSLDEIRVEQAEDLDPPSIVKRDVPSELDGICEMLTQRLPEERIENATKLLIELGKLRAGAGEGGIEAKLVTDAAERRMMAMRRGVFEEKWEFVDNMGQRMQAKDEGGPMVCFFRAKALSKLGRHDLAYKQYEKAIFGDPENREFLIDYAVDLMVQFDYAKAKAVLQKVPVGDNSPTSTMVSGLLQMLSRRDEWPRMDKLSEEAPKTARSSFIGRLIDKLRG